MAQSTDIRAAAVAGSFYPAEANALARELRAYLSATAPADAATPKALIVPHAGYVYSGPIAASAYALLAPARKRIRRVVLFGPAHRVPVRGLALPAAAAFASPLGAVEVDAEAVALALTLPQVSESALVHGYEHSLEVQLPFLQTVLADFRIVPFAVGSASAGQVAEVIDLLWGGPETLILISSDLSHYHGYAAAREIDRDTADRIVALTPQIAHDEACGATPINGLLLTARRRGMTAGLVDLRNSGDTAGDRSRVVGYGAFAFTEEHPDASR